MANSSASLMPSPSVSANRGLVTKPSSPTAISSPSLIPSPSVSALEILVPRENSSMEEIPSPSKSSMASTGSLGSIPLANSISSGIPSPSASPDPETSTFAMATTPSFRTVIRAEPELTAVIFPAAFTEAIAILELE